MSGTTEQSGQALNPCAHDPYPGLRPYEENEQDQFFGRDADTQILLDKILTHRLTLLFAATGVGKSSLLKAAVIPKLKAASGKHLDVAYYNDWVTAPLAGLKAEIARTVQQSANWPPGTVLDESLSLVEFVQFCTLFVRPPLVIMLDQFEELFRYRNKYHKDTFKPFIEELTGLITATQIPVSIVFSMREDFALELNAFKPKLPTLLFENYYRLERLPAGAARQAIVKPLPPHFAYEPALLEQLIQDLLKHDPDRDLSSLGADDETETVIPPQLQIVCSQLWQKECANADRLLHLAVYEAAGRTEGLLKNYVEQALKAFNERDRRVLSRAFDHLVSIQGTKMPHTVGTLAEKTGDSDKELMWVLEKLAGQDIRILRSQQREQKTWYELYHDMYSESINAWNRVQKRKMLWRQVKIWGSGVSGVVLVAYFGTVAYVHSVSHHLRLAPGDDNRVEIFSGRNGWPDPFGQKGFYAETRLLSREIEPDKRFLERRVLDYQEINKLLIAYRPLEKRVLAYVHTGDYAKALELFDKTIGGSGKQSGAMVRSLFSLKTSRGFNKIKPLAAVEQSAAKNKVALTLITDNTTELPLDSLAEFQVYQERFEQFSSSGIGEEIEIISPLIFNKLLIYLQHSNQVIRRQAVEVIGGIPNHIIIPHLINALDDDDEFVRGNAASVFGQFGDKTTIPHLLNMLGDDDETVREAVVSALGQIGDKTVTPYLLKQLGNRTVERSTISALGQIRDKAAVPQLVKVLNGNNEYTRGIAASALGLIGDETAIPYLIKALDEENNDVRQNAAAALGLISSQAAIPHLTKALDSDSEYVRQGATSALGISGDNTVVPRLIKMLNDNNKNNKKYAIEALGRIGDQAAVSHIIKSLSDNDEHVRKFAVEALGRIGDETISSHLIKLFGDNDENVRKSAAEALGNIDGKAAIPYLIKLLSDNDDGVRHNAASSLGQMGSKAAIPHLVKALVKNDQFFRDFFISILTQIDHSVNMSADLIEALASENVAVRQYAAEVLGQIGSRAAIPHLIEALADNDKNVRRSATKAIRLTSGLKGNQYRRKMGNLTHNYFAKQYGWHDYHSEWELPSRLSNIYGTRADRQQLLAALNLPVPEARDLLLIRLVESHDIHHSIREKAIRVLAKEGSNKQKIIAALQVLKPEKVTLKRTIKTALNQLQPRPATERQLALSTATELSIVKNQLTDLTRQYANWREFRDSTTAEDSTKLEDRDLFLKKVSAEKAKIIPTAAFDLAYKLSLNAPDQARILLSHELADVRQAAYTAFMMKANIQWLKKLDHLREQHRQDPIFRHAAFRAIDLGLWRLEALGNKNNNKEYKELMAWQKQLEVDKTRKQNHLDAKDTYEDGNPVDEVLERLQWTTMMMAHTKEMTAQYAKDGWVRDWPENALPVNQPYPELNP